MVEQIALVGIGEETVEIRNDDLWSWSVAYDGSDVFNDPNNPKNESNKSEDAVNERRDDASKNETDDSENVL